MHVLSGAKRRVENLSWSPDGVRLAAGGVKGPVEVWDTATGERTHSIPLTAVTPHDAIHFHPDGTLLVGGVGGLRRFNLDTSTHENCFDQQHPDHHLVLTPGGSTVIIPRGASYSAFECAGGYRRLWERHLHPLGGGSGATCFGGLAMFPDGTRFAAVEFIGPLPAIAQHFPAMAAADPDGSTIAVHDCATGEGLEYVPSPFKLMERPAISPDGSRYVVIGGRSLYVFRTDAFAEPPAKVDNDGKLKFTDIAYHPSGNYLAAASNDKTVKIYDAATWKVAGTFEWKLEKMKSVCFSPDGLRLAAGAEKGEVVVWDADL